ncbi:MAG: cobalamin-binding protein [Bryobacterales bacterium]|nr:cobalamin-binding protein [Bryobacterales bacterium]
MSVLVAAAAAPMRIVSTAPSITETLYALGLGSRVVGVTMYCTYPAEARSKPKIGSFLEPDFERILALKPDLVLVISNPIQVSDKLRKLGLRAEDVNQNGVQDILSSLARIGALTGTEKKAAALAASLRSEMDGVRRSVAGRARKSALFLVGRSPGTVQGMVGAGPGTFIDELMTIAGAQNVLASSPIAYPKVSVEMVLSSNPDVILDMGDFAHVEGHPMEPEAKLLEMWSRYAILRAVQTRSVRQVGSEIFIRPGPRMGEAARQLQRMVHGAAGR